MSLQNSLAYLIQLVYFYTPKFMIMKTITKKQQAVLTYVERFIESNGYSPTYKEISEQFEVNVNATQKVIAVLAAKGYMQKLSGIARGLKVVTQENSEDSVKKNLTMIPLYGKVAAGAPIFIDDNINGYIAVERNNMYKGNEFALTVEGESMIDKHIIDGDNIIVRKQSHADDGDVIVAMVDEEVTVKILRKRGSDIYLMPANELYKPIRKPFTILGVVIGLNRELNMVYGRNS